MSNLDDLQLEQVCTEKGKHTHKRRLGGTLAICYARGPFWVVSDAEAKERRLTPCANCERRKERVRVGAVGQGDKNFDEVVLPQKPYSWGLLEYIAWKRRDLGRDKGRRE